MTKDELIELQKKVTGLRAEGKYRETIENCYSLLKNGTVSKDYKSVLTAYMNLAASYYCIGDIEAAFTNMIAHEEICNKHGDDADRLNSYNVLFLLHEYNKAYDKAKETLEKSITLGTKLKKFNIVSNGYSNYSHVCNIEGNYKKALEMAIKGLEMARLHEPHSRILELRVTLNIAGAYIALNDMKASRELIDNMINDPVLDSFMRERAQCHDLSGHWFKKQELYKEAYEEFTKAKVLVESNNDVYMLKSIQEERCRLCELLGDIKSGYEVQKEYISLLNEISQRELSLTAMKYEIKRDIASLQRRVNIDQTTGVYNRCYVEATVNQWLNKTLEKDERIACIVFDIDKFKTINDEYGHLFGDEVIKLVSKACSQIIGEDGFISRYGGDEFIVILKSRSLTAVKDKAEEILKVVRSLIVMHGEIPIPVTISIGVTDNVICSAVDFNDLFNAADIELYNAKHRGRNQISCAH